MRLAQSFTKKLVSFLEFFYIFTPLGLLILTLEYIVLQEFYQDYLNILEKYEQAIGGEEVSTYTDYSNIVNEELVILALALVGLIFILTFAINLIVNRYLIKKSLKQGNYLITQKGTSINIETNFKPILPGSQFLLILNSNYKTLDRFVKDSDNLKEFLKKDHLGKYSAIFDIYDLASGLYEIPSFEIQIKDPLGFMSASVKFDLPINYQFISSQKLKSVYTELEDQLSEIDSVYETPSSNPTDSYFASREYRKGDSMKRINWKASAKSIGLVVRVPEDSTVDDDDTEIYLNLYLPHKSKINLIDPVAEFLEKSIARIKLIAKYSHNAVNLNINGEEQIKLKNIQDYNPDNLDELILGKSIFQDNSPVSEQLINEIDAPQKRIIFTLPIGKIDVPAVVYYLPLTEKFKTKLITRLQRLIKFDSIPRFSKRNIRDVIMNLKASGLSLRKRPRKEILKLTSRYELEGIHGDITYKKI